MRNYVIFVVDESGSMLPMKQSVLKSFNEFLGSQELKESYVSMITFNNMLRIVLNYVPLTEQIRLTEQSYNPNGLTAVYDAINLALQLANYNGIGQKTTIVIISDGDDNSSVKSLRETQDEIKKSKAEIVFLGTMNMANMATDLSIPVHNTLLFSATDEGVSTAMGTLTRSLGASVQSGVSLSLNA